MLRMACIEKLVRKAKRKSTCFVCIKVFLGFIWFIFFVIKSLWKGASDIIEVLFVFLCARLIFKVIEIVWFIDIFIVYLFIQLVNFKQYLFNLIKDQVNH